MQASFTGLVGTAIVPTHCFDSTELTDLTPALDTATALHDMAAHASEAAANTGTDCYGLLRFAVGRRVPSFGC